MNTKKCAMLFMFILLCCLVHSGLAQKPRLLIDADTGNEVDDLYAIVRLLIEPSVDIVGLNSTQWQASHWAVANTLEESHRLNGMLLSYLNMGHIRHPRGAHARLYDWGQDIAQHSAAAYHIIEQAHATGEDEKLNVMCMGALTNMASALLIDPSIASKVRLYFLGTSIDFDRKVWRKLDFNCMMDPRAVHVVLDAKELETYVMPVNVASAMMFDMKTLSEQFKDQHPLQHFLYQRWVDHMDGGRYRRTIWDLGLVGAFLFPERVTTKSLETPPENVQRPVTAYESIDNDFIISEFYQSVDRYLEQNSKN